MNKINLLDKNKFFMTKRVSLSAVDLINEIENELKWRFIKMAEKNGNDMERLGLEVTTERKEIPGYYAIEIRAFFIVSEGRKYSKKPRVIYGTLPSSTVYRDMGSIEKLLKNSGATQSIQSEILCTLHYLYNSAILYEKSHQKYYYPLQTLIYEVKEDYENMNYRAARFCTDDEVEIDLFDPISKENIAYKKLFDKFSNKVDELYNNMEKDDDKTYENKYKLGELVWLNSEEGIPMQVRVYSIHLLSIDNNVFEVVYNKLTSIEFKEYQTIRRGGE